MDVGTDFLLVSLGAAQLFFRKRWVSIPAHGQWLSVTSSGDRRRRPGHLSDSLS